MPVDKCGRMSDVKTRDTGVSLELNQCDVINFISRTINNKITNAYVSIRLVE